MADRLDTRRVRQQLQGLAADHQRWAQIDACLSQAKWPAEVDQLQSLAADLLRSHRALSALATKVSKRHWSPLLDPEGEP